MDLILLHMLDGLAYAALLFLIAAGVSLTYGARRLVNFTQGALFVAGAVVTRALAGFVGFWAATVIATLLLGGIGFLLDKGLLRRLERRSELVQAAATLGLGIALQGLLGLVGVGPGIGGFDASFAPYPLVNLLPLLPAGLVALGLRYWSGSLTNFKPVTVAVLGSGLAGLAGAVDAPFVGLHLSALADPLTAALAVWVIGGMDNPRGTLIAALVVGQAVALGGVELPYLAMALVLMLRPRGLFGYGSTATPGTPPTLAPLLVGARFPLYMLGAAALLVLAPLVVPDMGLDLVSAWLIWCLFAASLLLVSGLGGMTSLGHAAWFAIGAFVVSLSAASIGMVAAIFLAPLVVILLALGLARMGTYRQGVHLMLLTVAVGETARTVLALIGPVVVVRADWAAGAAPFFYLTLMLAGSGLALLWQLHASPFGFGLRAVRDQAIRAEALGINAERQRGLAFGAGAGLAGAAGGLFALLTGGASADLASLQTSFDGVAAILLGGIGSAVGPLIGGLGLTLAGAVPADAAHLVEGLAVLAVVLAWPGGVMGGKRS